METTPHSETLSIIPYLYTGTNARNILESYSVALREVGGRPNQLHANMLEHYVQISEDKEFIFHFRTRCTVSIALAFTHFTKQKSLAERKV